MTITEKENISVQLKSAVTSAKTKQHKQFDKSMFQYQIQYRSEEFVGGL